MIPYGKHTTVTINGMVPSQPGTNVSVTSGLGKHVLNVSRFYGNLPNQWGGKGVFKRLDCDKMEFPSSDAAFKYAYERGYLSVYHTSPDLRANRKLKGRQS